MKWWKLLPVALWAAGCTSVPSPVPAVRAERVLPSGPPSQQQRMDISLIGQTTAQDLLWSATQSYGEAMVRRALAAPTYIFAKRYAGMLPPPPPDASPDWSYPDPPVAMLVREDGVWLVAARAGFRQARSDKVPEIDSILRQAEFWAEPAWAPPGCTDAGASLLLAKVPGRSEIARTSACSTRHTELLAIRALEA